MKLPVHSIASREFTHLMLGPSDALHASMLLVKSRARLPPTVAELLCQRSTLFAMLPSQAPKTLLKTFVPSASTSTATPLLTGLQSRATPPPRLARRSASAERGGHSTLGYSSDIGVSNLPGYSYFDFKLSPFL